MRERRNGIRTCLSHRFLRVRSLRSTPDVVRPFSRTEKISPDAKLGNEHESESCALNELAGSNPAPGTMP